MIHLRTKENDKVSDFVLFLRLKGTYLFKLKNPNVKFRHTVQKILKDFMLDIMSMRKDVYPFNMYPIKLRHLFKTMRWIFFHFNKIKVSRKLEKTGHAHI